MIYKINPKTSFLIQKILNLSKKVTKSCELPWRSHIKSNKASNKISATKSKKLSASDRNKLYSRNLVAHICKLGASLKFTLRAWGKSEISKSHFDFSSQRTTNRTRKTKN